jgi:predicted metal-dependent enzyme (double-stranded beta helix superfamily)
MFDLDRFVADCRAALAEDRSLAAVREVVARAVSEPAAVLEALGEREAVPLGRDIIHSVTNPIPRLTGALHVYGGDFFGVPRSEWDPETLREQDYDVEKLQRLFEEANAVHPKA